MAIVMPPESIIPAKPAHAPGTSGFMASAARLAWAWPLAIGFGVMAIATFQGIARASWSTEQGAHGPIVLALAIWLLVRAWPGMAARAEPGSPVIGAALLVPSLILYAMARIVGSIVIESGALYLVFLATTYLFVGWRSMRSAWFPLAYLLFVLPPPGSFVALATQPLRLQISELAVLILSKLQFPVARSGLTIMVGQYVLAVKAACGGLNSMISLTAIGLFYAYLSHRRSLAYNLFLFACIILMAIIANLVRVMILILITYYLGESAASGFLHQFAGLTMVAIAMAGILLIDEIASRRGRKNRAESLPGAPAA